MAITVPRMAPRPPAAFAAGSVPAATGLTAGAREERMFLRTAAAQSRFELEASRLAFAKSTNGPVRALAAALVNHHNTMGLELAHLLNSRGMAMPMLANEQSKVLKQLNKLAGSKFDALYMQQVGMAQANVARDYEKASATIHEPQINAWIVKQVANTRYNQSLFERATQTPAQVAKWNRAARPQAKAPMADVQPVTATAVGRLNASDTQ